MTDIDEQDDVCAHDGVECELQQICTAGCCCDYCTRVVTDAVYAPVTKDTSDGHHTFEDLYTHRMALTLALAHSGAGRAWRSKFHNPVDSEMFDDMFIVGIELPTGQILYHYKLKFWDEFEGIREIPFAPKWDGAGPEDTIKRLLNYRKGWKC